MTDGGGSGTVRSVTGPAWREAALDALEHERFDLLVIGGGINGAGIARDAALRGLRVALVEQSDFASGTSSRSSKLIHGGLRYLEQGEIRLVLEATRERERLRRLAPHLVRPMRFVYPIYADGPVSRWKLAAGTLGVRPPGRHPQRPAASHARQPTPRTGPSRRLRTEGLRGAGEYWDCWTDDARLVLETLLSARDEGAVAVSYARVVGFVKEAGRVVGRAAVGPRRRPRADGARARGRQRRRTVGGRRERHGRAGRRRGSVRPRACTSSCRAPALGHEAAIVLHAVQDGRVMFVIPWDECSLVGTTDTDHPGGRRGAADRRARGRRVPARHGEPLLPGCDS